MKIIRLTAENVKKLKVVDITPAEGLNQITGRNGSGKTSVLDSIWWALGGKEGIQSVPIRKGAERGRVRLDLGTIIVERTFTPGGTSVIVMNPAGAEPGTPDKKLPKWGSPQEMLDALMGELSFDPLAFTRMTQRQQFDELRRISKLSVDIDALNAANEKDFKARTDINRDAKAKRTRAESFTIPADTPADPIDESALIDQIQAAGEHNASIETRKARRDQAHAEASAKKAEATRLDTKAIDIRNQAKKRVSDLQNQIAIIEEESKRNAESLEEQAIDASLQAADIHKKLASADPLPEPIAVTDLRANLDAAKRTNAQIEQRKQRDAVRAETDALEAQAKVLTDRIAEREKQKAEAIQSAEMPIEGLGFGDGEVTYNALPFDQASGAEQLRVSTSIAMAGNPKLRVIRIKDGSLLDDEGIAIIAQLAADKDYQVFLERVDASGKIGIVMEDGEVAGNHQAVA